MTIIESNQGWLKVSRKAAASEGWLQKAAEEADLIVDEEDEWWTVNGQLVREWKPGMCIRS